MRVLVTGASGMLGRAVAARLIADGHDVRTLQRSPAFSNNERYQFKYDVAPEFKDLHRFINKAADVGQTVFNGL